MTPESEYGDGPTIDNSTFKKIYEDIDHAILDSYKPNNRNYVKCRSKDNFCQQNTFCTFEKMIPVQEPLLQKA